MLRDKPTLYYVYDPMCSWCWGYRPIWDQIEPRLATKLNIVYVLGGLAPDSDVPMPEGLRHEIKSHWQKIENYLGTSFNYDFWDNNTPRRSTYPACRAALAARAQGKEKAMNHAIQQAYYQDAKNPSDNETLIELAANIGLDMAQFSQDLTAAATQQTLLEEIGFARSIGGNSFPSLFIKTNHEVIDIPIDYQNADKTIAQIDNLI